MMTGDPRRAKMRWGILPLNVILAGSLIPLTWFWWHERQLHNEVRSRLAAAETRTPVLAARIAELESEVDAQLSGHAGAAFPYRYRVRRQGRFDAALSLFVTAHRIQQRYLEKGHYQLQDTVLYLGELYNLTGQPKAAARYLQQYLDDSRAVGATDGKTAIALSHLGGIRLRDRKFGEAERLLRECVKIRTANAPSHWATFASMSSLRACLARQGRFAEAEPLLLDGWDGLIVQEARIWEMFRQKTMIKAVDRLIELYDEWDKPLEASKWKQRRKQLCERYPASED